MILFARFLVYYGIMERTDEQLIADYIEGDEHALDSLVDRHMHATYAFVFRLVGNASATEDITQDAFVKAWKHIRRYRFGTNFRTWLFSIARNTAIDWLRKKKELAFSEFETDTGNVLIDTLVDDAPRADELLARAHDIRFLESLLAELDQKYRDVVLLRHTSDLTFEEIGSVLHRPLDTVKSQYRRALSALQKLLKKPA